MEFSQARTPRLEFGAGRVARLPSLLADALAVRGGRAADLILVAGGSSFLGHPRHAELAAAVAAAGWGMHEFSCSGEPSPGFVDEAVAAVVETLGERRISGAVVAGVGGGSAMDAGKAVAAMLPVAVEALRAGEDVPSVKEFLEGVGTRKSGGGSALYAACPTTAGTGSEATKNAVISEVGKGGFKKSLRHDGYIPAFAVIDPELAVSCPRSVTAAGGLDAMTQLLEAWVSPAASPVTSALCESGFAAAVRAFPRVLADGADLEARAGMAYAAHLSGIALANAGLGSVHALASPVGGRFPVPHGVVCGTLLVPAAELASRSSTRLSRAGYLARLAADVMATDLVAEEAVGGGGGGGGVEAKL